MENTSVVHRFYLLGILLKGINGLVELGTGLLVLLLGPSVVSGIAQSLIVVELAEDPGDLVANFAMHHGSAYAAATLSLVAIYLCFYGLVKIGLVSALFMEKAWAYPAAGAVLSLFAVFQIFKIVQLHSVMLALVTLINALIILVLMMEYRNVRQRAMLKRHNKFNKRS